MGKPCKKGRQSSGTEYTVERNMAANLFGGMVLKAEIHQKKKKKKKNTITRFDEENPFFIIT